MSELAYKDPYPNFRFRIELDGIQRGGFREASGLDIKNEAISYREGNSKASTTNKVPGLTTYANITLRTGMTDDSELYEWMKQSVDGKTKRKHGSIILLDEAGEEKIRWDFERAFVVDWSGPNFNAGASEVAIESITIAHEGVARK